MLFSTIQKMIFHLQLGQHVKRLEFLEIKDLSVWEPELFDEAHINLLLSEICLLFLVKFKVFNSRESIPARQRALPQVPGSRQFWPMKIWLFGVVTNQRPRLKSRDQNGPIRSQYVPGLIYDQTRVRPAHNKECVEGDTEVLVVYLRNILKEKIFHLTRCV